MRQRHGSMGLVFMFIFNPIIILFYQNCSLTTQSSIAAQRKVFRSMSSTQYSDQALTMTNLNRINNMHLKINY